MTDGNQGEEKDRAAGAFSSWLVGIQDATHGLRSSDVPCAGCTACCTSSQFIHIGPDETDTLARISADLLFDAPRLPRGHVLLGYDGRGHCPMLIDDRCTIYEHRPRTCRTYDCRIFAATGHDLDDPAKVQIARRARSWRFDYPTPADGVEHDAVRKAVSFLDERRGALPDVAVPVDATQLAVLAIEVHGLFLEEDEESGETKVVPPDPDLVRHEVMRLRGRGPGTDAGA